MTLGYKKGEPAVEDVIMLFLLDYVPLRCTPTDTYKLPVRRITKLAIAQSGHSVLHPSHNFDNVALNELDSSLCPSFMYVIVALQEDVCLVLTSVIVCMQI